MRLSSIVVVVVIQLCSISLLHSHCALVVINDIARAATTQHQRKLQFIYIYLHCIFHVIFPQPHRMHAPTERIAHKNATLKAIFHRSKGKLILRVCVRKRESARQTLVVFVMIDCSKTIFIYL